jgi:hypothetical protein
MTRAHPEPAVLEAYVMGFDDQLPIEDIESHLRGCPPCTEEVRRQAQLEIALHEIAAETSFCPGCQTLRQPDRCATCGAVSRVQDFEVLRVLVQNSHGRMYLARDQGGGQVALKELAFLQPPHPDVVDAFEREGRLLRQLSHPQIPRFVDSFGQGEGVHTRLYLAQEFLEGESLLARLGRHQFREAEARDIARQVLDILVYLQNLSPMVFHRDIKPANLIRQPDGRIFLVDFGAARDMGATAGATLVGTFGYMPVEQLGGLVDATSDLYALGATLLHLLSRREPWSVLQEPEPLKRLNVTPEFRRFLRKLLAPRSQDRFPSAAAAAEALRRLDRPAGWRRTWLPLPPVMVAGLTAAILAGVVIAGFRWSAPLDPVPPTPVASAPRPVAARSSDRDMPANTVMVAPSVGRVQLAIDPNVPPYRPILPPEARRPGFVYWGLLKVCADAQGTVTRVTTIKPFSYLDLDQTVQETVRTWRYRPYLINGVPTPFCTPVRIELRGSEGGK